MNSLRANQALVADEILLDGRLALYHQTERWLAVEVLSPSSRVYDRDFKRDAYLSLGVQEVWLVDPTLEEIEVSRPRGQRENVRDLIRWRAPTLDVVVTINLRDVFPRH